MYMIQLEDAWREDIPHSVPHAPMSDVYNINSPNCDMSAL